MYLIHNYLHAIVTLAHAYEPLTGGGNQTQKNGRQTQKQTMKWNLNGNRQRMANDCLIEEHW